MDSCFKYYFKSMGENNNFYVDLDERMKKALSIEEKVDIILEFWKTYRGRHTSYVKYQIEEISKEASIQKSDYALGWCYFMLGWLILDHDEHEQGADQEKGIAYFVEAQERFDRSGEQEARIRAINGEAAAYRQYGYFDIALEKYLNGLEQAEAMKSNFLTSILASNIGNLLIDLKQYEEAIDYFNKAQQDGLVPSVDMAIQYSNIGKAYRCLGNLQKAEEKVLESLELCRAGGNRYATAYSILEMGFIKQWQGKIDEAKDYFKESLGLSLERRFPRIKATALLQLGIIESTEGKHNEALPLLNEALDIFREIKARNFEVQALLAISDVYDGLGDYDRAYAVLKEGKELEGQVFNEETINMMSILKVQQARKEGLIYKDLYQRISTISNIGQTITSTLDINEIGSVVYKHIKNLMEVDNLIIGLYAKDEGKMTYKINIQNGEFSPENTSQLKDINDVETQCIYYKKGVLISDVNKQKDMLSNENYQTLLTRGISSLICSPLIIRDQVLGLISAQSKKKNAYSIHHLDILNALAAYAAIALENEKLFSYVKELATTDHLTELPNRRNVFEQAQKEFSRSKRYEKPLAVIMADVDSFKKINDSYGHAVGDAVLKEVAKTFTSVARNTDMLGRIGGEEFLFVLPNTKINEAAYLANRLCNAISTEEYDILENKICITLSFGVAEINPADDDITEIIKRADSALYSAKDAGGNQVCLGENWLNSFDK